MHGPSKPAIATVRRAVLLIAFGSLLAVPEQTIRAQAPMEPSRPNTADNASDNLSPAQKYFTDVLLINQNGEKMRFYSDLLKGKVVIINSFFATCRGACLPLNRNLEKVQEALGDHVGKDVHIISITVDPNVDTPAN